MLRLSGKNAVITGAASDFGRAIALRFAAEGANVLVAATDIEDAREVAAEAEKNGHRAVAAAVEVGDEAQVERMVEQAVRELGGIDVLRRPRRSLMPGMDRAPIPAIASWTSR